MTSIFPPAGAGGLTVSDGAGNDLAPPNVANYFVPPAGFTVTCDIDYLPSTCDARVTSEHINGIISELLCFASAIDPTGSWNCDSHCNLAVAFENWRIATNEGLPVGDISDASIDKIRWYDAGAEEWKLISVCDFARQATACMGSANVTTALNTNSEEWTETTTYIALADDCGWWSASGLATLFDRANIPMGVRILLNGDVIASNSGTPVDCVAGSQLSTAATFPLSEGDVISFEMLQDSGEILSAQTLFRMAQMRGC